MKPEAKSVRMLTPEDLIKYPVWEFALGAEDEYPDETWAVPIAALPVDSLENRVVGIKVQLNNLDKHWAILENVSLSNPLSTEQFLFLGIWVKGTWINLARYFDLFYSQMGPQQLADALGLPLERVFPITYDLSAVAIGHPEVIRGRINNEPSRKLSRDERMKLI